MTEHEKSRKHYEQSGTYDQNMEYFKECEVNSGAWVLITRQIPVDERCKPHILGHPETRQIRQTGLCGSYDGRCDIAQSRVHGHRR